MPFVYIQGQQHIKENIRIGDKLHSFEIDRSMKMLNLIFVLTSELSEGNCVHEIA